MKCVMLCWVRSNNNRRDKPERTKTDEEMLKFQTETDLPLSFVFSSTLTWGHHRIMEATESHVLF